jgi:CubicO group peptidase (beta-lactamase class C family)
MIATPRVRPVQVAMNTPAVTARVAQILNRRPAVGFAVGVVRSGGLEFFHGHGLADIASNSPVTEDTVFRIASITKTFTAIAVLQLWERGLVDLDAPANRYLRSFQLLPKNARFGPTTLRQLLTHTSGISEMVRASRSLKYVFGESFGLEERLPPPGEYYRGRLRVEWEPGTRFVYTDHNFATLGQIVEDVTGISLDHYMREHIFEPLGMTSTDLNRSDFVESHLATGYNLGSSGPQPVTDRQWVTFAASSIYSSPRDMGRYVAAVLGAGANQHGSILKPATMAMMFAPHYQPDPRVPGMGLAFSRVNLGGHRAVEHEGILPGFNSQIFIAPDDGVGVIAFTNGASQAMLWLPGEVAGLLSLVLGVPEEAVRTDVPQHPEIWNEICGWYPFSARLSDLRARTMLGAGVQVSVRGGQLMLRILSPVPAALRGFVLHADDDQDPYVFRMQMSDFGIGTARVVFSHEPAHDTTKITLDLMPLSLQRRKPNRTARRNVALAAGAIAVMTAVFALRRRGKTSPDFS